MVVNGTMWKNILQIFGYYLLFWKLLIAIGFSAIGPLLFHTRFHKNQELVHSWMTNEVIVLLYVIGALAGYFIVKKHITVAIVMLLTAGAILLTHYFHINKFNVISILFSFWELVILCLILWQLRKSPMTT